MSDSVASTDDSAEPATAVPPAVVLVEPQLGENIGTAARAMANFGLDDLRLVNPRDGWPSEKAVAAASGAAHVIERVRVFETTEAAIADLGLVLATTARARGFHRPVLGPEGAAARALALPADTRAGILFGRERWGLNNDEVALADAIVTYPVDPRFASLNIAQAVLLFSYEWRRQATGAALPFEAFPTAPPASKQALVGLFEHLEAALEPTGYFRPPEMRPVMVRNLRTLLQDAGLTETQVHLLRGVVAHLEGRRGRPIRDRATKDDGEE
ncbi:RNA methyltransferase [Amorphus sp. 3PC139-8]|uniref:RNA methyltransferase n=1 Tax=Amorphus sp. 3PC139-8 TaxID=2735676 RepID=UPI00345DD8C4